jgi:hypothetical protein
MVKNTHGGNKHKGMARKLVSGGDTFRDPVPNPPYEFIAIVEQMLGNSNCLVYLLEKPQTKLICHIRGKFKGRHKSGNIISRNSSLIVGLRHWENVQKNCDLLAVLQTSHAPAEAVSEHDTHSNIVFANEDDETDETTVILQSNRSNTDEDDIIDIDDI